MSTWILYNAGVALSTTDANNLVKYYQANAFDGLDLNIVERTVDCGNMPNQVGSTSAMTTNSGDVLQLFPIMPKSMILAVGLEVITLDGTNPTGTVALADSVPNAWVGATAMSSGNVTTGLFTSTLTNKVYQGTDYIKATIGTANLTNAVFRGFMIVCGIARSDQGKNLKQI